MNQTSFCTSDSTNVVNDVVIPWKFLLITLTYVSVMKSLLRMHAANMNDRGNMNESKDSTHSFQLSEREKNPAHTCTQDTPKKYSHWYGRYPWLAFIIGPPLLFLTFTALNCFVFYLLLSFVAEGRTVETSPLIMRTVFWASQTIAFVPAIGAALLLCWMVIDRIDVGFGRWLHVA